MPNFILLEYIINNRCIYLLLINFFYKQANNIIKMLKKSAILISFRKCFNQIFIFVILQYIVVSNLEADVLPTKGQFYYLEQVVLFAPMFFE